MAGEIELLTKRVLTGLVGYGANGLAGVQLASRSRNNVALYGDSLIAAASLDGLSRRSASSHINIANALAGQRMRFVRRRAVSGYRSDQILQAFEADFADGSLVASGAGTLYFNGGTNDVGSNGYTDIVSGAVIPLSGVAANAVANFTRIIDVCTSLGIQCIFQTVHGATGWSAAQIAACEDLNRRIRRLPLGRPMWLLETRDVLRNALTTTASAIAFRSGLLYDNTHPGVGGAYALGKALTEIVRLAIPPLPSSYSDATDVYSANLTTQLLDNAVFSGTSGTLGTGGTLGTNPAGGALAGLPTGYSLTRATGDTTTTFTVNVGEDAESRYMDIIPTASAQASGVKLQFTPSSVATKLFPGYGLQLFSKIEVLSGAVNLAAACPYLDFNVTVGGVAATYPATGAYSLGGVGAYPSTEGFVFEDATDELIAPAFTSVQWITVQPVSIVFAGAGSATVRVRKPRLDVVAAIPALAA